MQQNGSWIVAHGTLGAGQAHFVAGEPRSRSLDVSGFSSCRTSNVVPSFPTRAANSPTAPSAAACGNPVEQACIDAWPAVVRYMRAVVGPGADAEDLAARCVEVAWRRRGELGDLGSFPHWMFAIAAHVARNARRGDTRRGRLVARLAGQRQAYAPDPAARVPNGGDQHGPAMRALGTLPRADREVLVLHAWEELTAAEIAPILGISPAAAAKRLTRARGRLAAALHDHDRDPEESP